ncbi:MAG: hypothetical protein PVH88_07115 [Ignavibacteria bacterium]|jgi:adenylate cyclase
MKNVIKYQLKEVVYSIIFFIAVVLIYLWVSVVKDFPLLRIIVGAIFFSLCVSFYEMYLSKKLQKLLNTPLYFLVTILYYVVIFFIMLIGSIYVNLYFKDSFAFQGTKSTNILSLIPDNIQLMFFYLFSFLTIYFLLLQLKTRTLKGVVRNYFWGKPDEPLCDTRIFMFMDLISSTTYAEKLGSSKYSKFIKGIYQELDEFVLETKGNIYQYVGDEVVVVWPLNEGLRDYNCIRFLFLFEGRMTELKEEFEDKYGIFPKFKAASIMVKLQLLK